jgi:hypothetical protein
MGSITKIQPVFFDRRDEDAFSDRLRTEIPDIAFVDDNRWPASTPVTCFPASSCKSRFVYLWNRAHPKVLPYIKRPSGDFEGPASGVVIQWMRSSHEPSVLFSGQLSVAYDSKDAAMRDFVNRVWQILKRMNAAKLQSVSDESRPAATRKPVSDYIVGDGARAYAASGGTLKHATAPVAYKLA